MNTQHPEFRHIRPAFLLDTVAGDQMAARSLMDSYQRLAPPMMARLEQAIAAADHPRIAMESHTLKSSATLLGANALGAMLELAERGARRQDAPPAGSELEALRTEFLLVMREVERYLDLAVQT